MLCLCFSIHVHSILLVFLLLCKRKQAVGLESFRRHISSTRRFQMHLLFFPIAKPSLRM